MGDDLFRERDAADPLTLSGELTFTCLILVMTYDAAAALIRSLGIKTNGGEKRKKRKGKESKTVCCCCFCSDKKIKCASKRNKTAINNILSMHYTFRI